MESFFGSLKKEFVYLYDFENIEEVQLGIAAYIDFYNKIRIHSFNDYRSPNEKRAEYYVSLPSIWKIETISSFLEARKALSFHK